MILCSYTFSSCRSHRNFLKVLVRMTSRAIAKYFFFHSVTSEPSTNSSGITAIYFPSSRCFINPLLIIMPMISPATLDLLSPII
ncbi:hypothetical protein HOR11_gp052 [Lactobacillus phage SA-C12]|uniref:Uncharacterized protein n=1 Tax=Lactobacillus phage SA-C12 TaxID=1755697 RepID=A0A1I9KK86_9CAUD|nr:hypothetical protein HOR11_gp052 [Lactobacillus phage SA-C12]ALY06873.1 hypothetical protein SAC12_052 [Lactobacillus phage SA-C12]